MVVYQYIVQIFWVHHISYVHLWIYFFFNHVFPIVNIFSIRVHQILSISFTLGHSYSRITSSLELSPIVAFISTITIILHTRFRLQAGKMFLSCLRKSCPQRQPSPLPHHFLFPLLPHPLLVPVPSPCRHPTTSPPPPRLREKKKEIASSHDASP